ncbi:Jag N-terminal domain-containing protein [Poseidonibacter lekithochrous]|uniref:Jag N-terminal domain-containing protein n=1 Tax=Poseidonibacter TaxID=2321187 RepID=UPI001C097DEE|nr:MULTISPECIES: Jag N-terminal domain-containing protein [Poseidonibacter]MBU3015703.1 Jag N-terminal domain-containing protein [Poseidonibacter lekithochrous]MDO6829003.1 Jag N-terminal domain-containing protein [Poseidonibacter sp. 1_MG-2023]
MKKFEAKCLEEVYEIAAADFECSITELDINVIQQPSKGFLGFGKKTAIIEACFKDNCKKYEKTSETQTFRKKDIQIDDVSKRINDSNKSDELAKKRTEAKEEPILNEVPKDNSKDKIFDNFYNEDKSQSEISTLVVKKDKEYIIEEVSASINLLFKDTCYEIDNIKIDFYDEETLYVEFTGEDCALLIGKEGYRYKALSYILFNWINEKYGLMLRLEVAEFLKNQEASIYAYLEPVIEVIKEKGTFKTKPLDGILVHIALKKLREEFPNKYVAVKTNVRGDKYVLVNEYKSKEQ